MEQSSQMVKLSQMDSIGLICEGGRLRLSERLVQVGQKAFGVVMDGDGRFGFGVS